MRELSALWGGGTVGFSAGNDWRSVNSSPPRREWRGALHFLSQIGSVEWVGTTLPPVRLFRSPESCFRLSQVIQSLSRNNSEVVCHSVGRVLSLMTTHAQDISLMQQQVTKLWQDLPQGHLLESGEWARRHRGIVWLLWLHAIGLPAFGLLTAHHVQLGFEGGVILAVLAVVATSSHLTRRVRAAIATSGLILSSAVLVHLSGGVIEAHFHFFVMITVIVLYQDWVPFLLALLSVIVDHGVIGTVAPTLVYNHAGAQHHPWSWALIHGGFILAECAALLVYWRVNETIQADLLSEKKKAEAASTAKSQFLANMSHEIRTPMNGVLGMAELLSLTPLSDKQRRYVEQIRGSGDQLLHIINDVLDFSKIEAGKMVLEHRPFDLAVVIKESVDSFMERAQGKGLALSYSLTEGLPTKVIGDAARLRQVLTNLIGNAIKFTESGSVAVMVQGISDVSAGFKIVVQDTGIGISEADQTVLFQEFSQADASSTRKYGGTGLGLAISKQLVEMMRGTIGVQGAVGSGSQFWFTVQFERQKEPVANPGQDTGPEGRVAA